MFIKIEISIIDFILTLQILKKYLIKKENTVFSLENTEKNVKYVQNENIKAYE